MQRIYWVLDNGQRYIDTLREDLVNRGYLAGLVTDIDAFLDDQVSGNARALIMLHDPTCSVIPALEHIKKGTVQTPIVVLFQNVDVMGITEIANLGTDLIYPLDMDVDEMYRRLVADVERLGGDLLQELSGPSEVSLLAKMENLADWVWRIDDEDRITFSSESVRKILGYTHTDLKGKVLWKLTPTIEMSHLQSQLENVKHIASEPSGLEFVIISKSGTVVHLEGLAMPLFDVDGSYMGMIAACRDITTHKKAVEDLMIAEDRYGILFESSPDPIVTLSPGGRIESVNLAGVSLLGATRANELIGRNFYSFIAENEKHRANTYFNDLLSDHEHFQSEFIFQRDNGTSLLMEVSAAVLLDSAGKPSCVITILHDASQRNRIAYEFHTNGFHHPQLSLESQDIFAEIDQDLCIRYISSNFENITGIPVREVIGKAPFDLMESEDRLNLIEELEQVLSRMQPFFSVRYRARRSDGKILHFEFNGIPFFDDENRFRGYRTLVRNVTDRVEKEIALKLEQQKLETIIRNISESIWITDLDFNFLYVSQNLRGRVGISDDPMNYEDFRMSLDPGSFEKLSKAYKMLVNVAKKDRKSNPIFKVETKVNRKDGTHYWSEQKITLIRKENDEAIGILGVGRDITEAKGLEARLRASEERFQGVLRASEQEMLMIDPQSGYILEANARSSSELGYSKEELLGQHLSFVLNGWNRDDLAILRDRVMSGEVVRVEGEHRRKDGVLLDVETSMIAVPWDDRIAVLAMVRDISEIKEIRASLAEKGADLQAMSRLAQLPEECLSTDDLLASSLRVMLELVQFDAGAIFFLDPISRLRLRSHGGIPEEGVILLEEGDIPIFDLQNLAMAHEPAWVEKAVENSRKAKEWGLESYVVFPLLNGTRSMGAMVLGSIRNELVPYERRELLRACWKQICDSLTLMYLKDIRKDEVAQTGLEALRIKN